MAPAPCFSSQTQASLSFIHACMLKHPSNTEHGAYPLFKLFALFVLPGLIRALPFYWRPLPGAPDNSLPKSI
jgi:hypothetical protein